LAEVIGKFGIMSYPSPHTSIGGGIFGLLDLNLDLDLD